ncbi:hypothetical protein EJD88_11075 [Pseudomonas sp. PB105]|uniref:hypothetical protein n=1 Tax=Pseudomonas TaxID=286 RepID=UPI000DD47EF5|nr:MULTISPECIES: hypothetical protein [Pseudomonas]KAE9655814.1 hypothetical protein EJD88_11075 [Pseudomonas sp. PB105]MBD8238325.1 hypothetical protein [Pseudomonas fluorescens]MDY0895912.1 hypothetical protein [Pseudomonas fluorescens]MVW99040.1 hypothetical protein [Pseudomonas sp. PB100]
MDFFKDLPLNLLQNSKKAYTAQKKGAEEAMETGDLDFFNRLLIQQHYSDFAYQEQGRINHQILRTTFDSFQ